MVSRSRGRAWVPPSRVRKGTARRAEAEAADGEPDDGMEGAEAGDADPGVDGLGSDPVDALEAPEEPAWDPGTGSVGDGVDELGVGSLEASDGDADGAPGECREGSDEDESGRAVEDASGAPFDEDEALDEVGDVAELGAPEGQVPGLDDGDGGVSNDTRDDPFGGADDGPGAPGEELAVGADPGAADGGFGGGFGDEDDDDEPGGFGEPRRRGDALRAAAEEPASGAEPGAETIDRVAGDEVSAADDPFSADGPGAVPEAGPADGFRDAGAEPLEGSGEGAGGADPGTEPGTDPGVDEDEAANFRAALIGSSGDDGWGAEEGSGGTADAPPKAPADAGGRRRVARSAGRGGEGGGPLPPAEAGREEGSGGQDEGAVAELPGGIAWLGSGDPKEVLVTLDDGTALTRRELADLAVREIAIAIAPAEEARYREARGKLPGGGA